MNNTTELEVLIVDDDFISIEIIEENLKDFIYKKDKNNTYILKIKSVNNSTDAVNELCYKKYDLGILDYKMPGKNGLEISRFIRDKKPFIPIIIVSNYNIEQEDLLEAGIVAYDSKQNLKLLPDYKNTFLMPFNGNKEKTKDLKNLIISIFNKIISYRDYKLLEQKNFELKNTINNVRNHIHNINNKLNICFMNLEYASRYKYDELSADIAVTIEDVHQSVCKINESTKEIQDLISNNMKIQKPHADISIESIISDLMNLYKNKIEISIKKCSNIPLIFGNSLQIYDGIQNLFVNSMEAGATMLKLDLFTHENYVVFSIEDNGEGISHQALDKILEQNFSTKKGSNRGLGLFSLLTIITQHNGIVEVISKKANEPVYKLKGSCYENLYITQIDESIETGTIFKLFFPKKL